MLPYDPSRQDVTRIARLGAPRDPHITVADEEQAADLDATVRWRLRREQVIGGVIVVILVVLLAAYFILKPRFLGW